MIRNLSRRLDRTHAIPRLLACVIFASVCIGAADCQRLCAQQAIANGVTQPKVLDQKLFQIFKLESVDAESALKTARSLLSDNAGSEQLFMDVRNNGIIVRGNQKQIDQIGKLLKLIDRPSVEDAASLKIYDLRYIDVDLAIDILSSLLQRENSTRMSAEPRLNRLIIYGTESVHRRVQTVLEQVDVATKASTFEVLKLETDSRGGFPTRDLLSNAADEFSLKLEMMPQLGVAVVRGDGSDVESFRKRVTTVLEAASKTAPDSVAAAKYDNVLVRLIWLAAFDEGEELPENLQPIAARAAQFGMKDLKIMGQLVGIAGLSENGEQEFQIHGETQHNLAFSTEGSIAFSSERRDAVTAFISIAVANQKQAVAQLSLNLPIGKPTMIASAPVGGAASVFVIEALPSE